MRNRRRLLLLLPLAAAGALAWAHRPGLSTPPPAATNADHAGGGAEPSRPATIPVDGWRSGKRHRYRLSFSVTFGPVNALRPIVALGANLETTVLESTAEGTEVEWRMSSPVFDDAAADGARPAASRSTLRETLPLPFVVSYDDRGRPLGLRLDPRVPGEVKGFIKELVSSAQFARPTTAAASWRAIDRTPFGDVEARYAALGAPREFTRHRAGRTVASAADGHATNVMLPAQDWFRLGEDGRVERVVASQRYEVELPDGSTKLASVASTALDLLEADDAPTAARAPVNAVMESLLLAPPPSGLDGRAARARGILGGATRAELLRDAADPAVLGDDKRLRGVARRLGALVTLDPSVLAGVVAGARDASDRRPYIAALTESASPAAQAALATLAGDRAAPSDLRLAAVDALGAVDRPTAGAHEALDQALRDPDPEVRKSAGLGLGAAAFNTATSDPAQSSRSVQALRENLRAARSTAEIVEALEALGNTGSAEVVGDVADALRSPDVAIREAAARALRLVPGERSDRLLAAAIAADPAPEVRIAALFAAEFRPLAPLIDAITPAVRTGAVEIRRAAILALGAALRRGEDSLAAPLLSWAADHDASAEVRTLAASSLAGST